MATVVIIPAGILTSILKVLSSQLFLQLEVYWTKQSLLGVLIEETLSNGGDL